MMREILNEPNISRYLAQTERENLTYRRVVREMEYIFRHAMIKDVVYDSILRTHRREFHKLVGEGIERFHEKEIERFYDVLAYHFTQGTEWEKALDYNLKAGRQAAKDHHNEAAILYFSKTAEIGENELPSRREELYNAYKGLAEIYMTNSSYAMARGYYQNAIAATGVTDKERFVDTLNGVADTYYRLGDYEQALKTGEEACVMSREIKYKKGIASSLNSTGRVHYDQGRYEEGLRCHSESLKIRRKIGDRIGIATSLNNIAALYYRQGRYEEALKSLRESLGIKRDIGDKYAIAAGLGNIGLVHSNQGQYEEALKHYAESLEIQREIGDKRGIASNLNNIGLVHLDQGRNDEALKYCSESLKIKREIGDKYGTAGSLSNMGIAYKNRGRYNKALKYYEESLGLFREIGDRYGIASNLNNMGSVHHRLGRYDEALKHYAESLEIEKGIGNDHAIASAFGNIGLVHLDQGRYEESLKCFTKCEAIFRDIGDRKGIGSVLADAATISLSLGSFGDAVGNAEEAVAVFEEARAKAKMLDILATLILAYAEVGTNSHLQKARESVRKAKRIEKETSPSEKIARFRLSMSRFHEAEAQRSENGKAVESRHGGISASLRFAEEALQEARELKQPAIEAEALIRLCELSGGSWSAPPMAGRALGKCGRDPSISRSQGQAFPVPIVKAWKPFPHTPERTMHSKEDSKKAEEYATKALSIAKKTKSLPLLWKSQYWLYKATGDKKHLEKAEEHLKEQLKHVPRKYLKDFRRWLERYTGEELGMMQPRCRRESS
jgi:tetratricopeptide (TPR) repeat protein